jgi:hypothetical protein
MTIDDLGIDDSTGSAPIPLADDVAGQGEDDRDRRDTGVRCSCDQCPSRVWLDIRGVDDDRSPGGEPADNVSVEDREDKPRRSLVGLVAAHGLAQGV